ncbi:MAG: anti-sigma factor family protein [Bacteroidales bacterium]
MRCIKTEIIQKYIDGEISPEETALIEEHISDCEKCAAAVEQQKRMSDGIIKAINLFALDNKEIPAFVAPSVGLKKPLKTIKRAAFYISAACILLFILLILPKGVPENHHQISIIHSIGPEVDANKPVTRQEIVVYVIDENGNIIEHHFN